VTILENDEKEKNENLEKLEKLFTDISYGITDKISNKCRDDLQ